MVLYVYEFPLIYSVVSRSGAGKQNVGDCYKSPSFKPYQIHNPTTRWQTRCTLHIHHTLDLWSEQHWSECRRGISDLKPNITNQDYYNLLEAFANTPLFYPEPNVLQKPTTNPQVMVNYDMAHVFHRNRSSHCSQDQLPMTQRAYLIRLKSTPSSSFSNITLCACSLPRCADKRTPSRQLSHHFFLSLPLPLRTSSFSFSALYEKPSHVYYSVGLIQTFHETIGAEM